MINIKRQSQFELFPGSLEIPNESSRRSLFLKDLTLSPENIIVLAIIFLMGGLLFFAFGVEQGRRVRSVANSVTPVIAPKQELPKIVNPKAAVSGKPMAVSPVQNPSVSTYNSPVKTIEQRPAVVVPMASEIAQKAGQYTIQVASFKSQNLAAKEGDILKKIGYEIYILTKGSHAIVCVGKFSGMDDAKNFARRLKNRYSDCLVRRF